MLEKRKNTFRKIQFRRRKQFARGKNCDKAGKKQSQRGKTYVQTGESNFTEAIEMHKIWSGRQNNLVQESKTIF
jgi:hypothetical protein